MLRTVEADGNAISYTLERKPVKNINLRIRPDNCVYVSAPKDVVAKMVDAFVVEKSAYILRALKRRTYCAHSKSSRTGIVSPL